MKVILAATKKFNGDIDIELFDLDQRVVDSNSHPGKIRKSQELLDLEYMFRTHPDFIKYKKLYEKKVFGFNNKDLLLKMKHIVSQVGSHYGVEVAELISYRDEQKIDVNGDVIFSGETTKFFRSS